MLTKEEFFLKTDSEIRIAEINKLRYFYLISQLIPCTTEEFKNHYKQYTAIEMRPCRNCKPTLWDIIINLESKITP